MKSHSLSHLGACFPDPAKSSSFFFFLFPVAMTPFEVAAKPGFIRSDWNRERQAIGNRIDFSSTRNPAVPTGKTTKAGFATRRHIYQNFLFFFKYYLKIIMPVCSLRRFKKIFLTGLLPFVVLILLAAQVSDKAAGISGAISAAEQ